MRSLSRLFFPIMCVALLGVLLLRETSRREATSRASPADARAAVAPENRATGAEDAPTRASKSTASGTYIAAPQSSAAGAKTSRWPDLPPADTPLAQIVDQLDRRARAGDAKAACRLGAEMMRCMQARSAYTGTTGDRARADEIARVNVSAAERERLIEQHLRESGRHSILRSPPCSLRSGGTRQPRMR